MSFYHALLHLFFIHMPTGNSSNRDIFFFFFRCLLASFIYSGFLFRSSNVQIQNSNENRWKETPIESVQCNASSMPKTQMWCDVMWWSQSLLWNSSVLSQGVPGSQNWVCVTRERWGYGIKLNRRSIRIGFRTDTQQTPTAFHQTAPTPCSSNVKLKCWSLALRVSNETTPTTWSPLTRAMLSPEETPCAGLKPDTICEDAVKTN